MSLLRRLTLSPVFMSLHPFRRDGCVVNPRHSRAADRSGQVLVLVVIALVALIGFAALAIDVGHAYTQRRQLQNAADAAALAGARLVCASGSDSAIWSEVQNYVNSNSNHLSAITVTAYYTTASGAHTGGTLPNGSVPSDATGVEVSTRSTTPAYFGRVVGFAAFQPAAVGAAKCSKGVPAIFADKCGQPSNTKVIDWSGGTYLVIGDIRSNSDLNMSGSNNTISNSTISTGSGGVSPAGLAGKATTPSSSFTTDTSCQPYPVTFNIADYAPGGSQAVAAGATYYHSIVGNSSLSTYVHSGVMDPGIYYVTGNVNFATPSVTANVTIVATGSIIISSGSSTWTPYAQGLLYYSNISDASAPGHIALNVSGSGSSWTGIIYAPNSGINMSGSSNASLQGNLLGYTVKLSGSSLLINSGSAGPSGVYLYE